MRSIWYIVISDRDSIKQYYAGLEWVCTKLDNGSLCNVFVGEILELTIQTKLFVQTMADYSSCSLGRNDLDIACNENSQFIFNVAFGQRQAHQHANLNISIDLEISFATKDILVISEENCEDGPLFSLSDLYESQVQSQSRLKFAEMNQSVRSKHPGSASWITDYSGREVQHLQYLSYGKFYINRHLSSYNECFASTGKERDEETGYGYFGARYMDHELMTMWLSVDPMADKYPSISPYAYCAWNPMKLVDPNGREVVLNGTDENKQKAITMMTSRLGRKSKLTFSVDEEGSVSCTGEAKTKMEKYMKKIIENIDITVNLTVQESNEDENGVEIYGGSFDGNKFKTEAKDKINAYQTVDLITANENDLKVSESYRGQTIWHEISEAFEGGLFSIEKGQEATKAYRDENNPIYNYAHDKASMFFPASPKSIFREDQMGCFKFNVIVGYEFE